MSKQNPVYVRFSLEEALFSKGNLVSCEMEVLKLLKILKKYELYKKEAILIDTKIIKNIQEIKKDLVFLDKELPEVKETEEVKKSTGDSDFDVLLKASEKKDQSTIDLERQLEEIQARIKAFE
jgi:ABC-type oligopeptide transport system ATPase subunit